MIGRAALYINSNHAQLHSVRFHCIVYYEESRFPL